MPRSSEEKVQMRCGESQVHTIAKDRCVVVVEHDMEFVRRLNTYVTVLHEGSVLAEGSLDKVQADQRVIEVYLGR